LTYSILILPEAAIREKMIIEASQRMIREQNNSSAVKKHYELQIKTLLQNARIEIQRNWNAF
jgi:hypothetical protein